MRSRQVLPQAVWPEGHEMPQTPAVHTRPVAQTVPHAPQLRLSFWRSRQVPEQLVSVEPQVTEQVPETQA